MAPAHAPSAFNMEAAHRPGAKGTLHYGRWMFVDQVTIQAESVVFQFNPSCATRGPFKVELSIRPTDGRNPQHWSAERDLPRDRFTIRFKEPITSGTVIELKLDGRLAYRNAYVGGGSVL